VRKIAHITINNKTTGYTLAISDHNKIITVNSGSDLTITLPQTSSVDIPDGFTCKVIRRGSGAITFAIQGAETLESANSYTRIGPQYGAATVIRLGSGLWYIHGDLVAA
jgi:hypothetical protein